MPKTNDWAPETEDTDVFPVEVVDEVTGPLVHSIRLVCVAGEELGKTFRVTTTPFVVGRSSDADVVLDSPDVSRRHARLTIKNGEYWVEDLGSVNGTFVNAARIEGGAPIRVGDRLQIGNTILNLAIYDELEARMQQLQRVEAMAAMAGGLAHDFRNALAVISAGLEALDELLPAQASELRDTTDDMKTATKAATALATRLLNLGRREPSAYDLVNLLDVIRETTQMSRHLLGHRIRITTDIAAMILVRGSREELHQVIMNLLVNAKDAMPKGGEITISAEIIRLERARSLALHLPGQGSYVALEVTDTGSGMDERTLARAFEPFFTTKPPGVGSGLGLSVIHGIVKRHGGAVLADSRVGSGTTIRIYLPVAQ